MSELQYYVIESTADKFHESYRYVSLYNSSRGIWRGDKEKAIKDGEAHRALIILHLGIID